MHSTSSPAAADGLPPRWQRLRRVERWLTVGVLTLWGLLLAAWLTLHWIILPHIDEWRPRIERLASEAVGLKVGIGAIQVQSSGWVPALHLRDLRLYDRQGREALHLASVQTALAPQMLLALQLRFQQVLIDGASLEVRRDAQGRWHVAGLDWDDSAERADTRARDWFLEQHEFVVRNAELRFTDEYRGTAPMLLSQVDLVLRNGLRRHALRLDATPPPAWGDRFTLRGRFTQPLLAPSGEFGRWSGVLYAEFPRADVAALRRQTGLPLELAEGEGAVRGWLDIENGVPRKATLDFALDTLALQLTPALQPLRVEQISGRVDAERDAGGVRMRAHDLGFRSADGRLWPAGTLSLSWRQAQDLRTRWPSATEAITGGELQAERLNLEMLAHIAESLPLGAGLREKLLALQPQGNVESLQARWDGRATRPTSYQVRAKLQQLGLQAQPAASGPGQPGFSRAEVELTATERGGEATVAIRGGTLLYPGMWEDPLVPLDELQAALSWRIDATPDGADAVELKLGSLSVANADLQAELSATWQGVLAHDTPHADRGPGRLDLRARVLRARAQSVARYLPLAIDEEARAHVRDAVRGGRIRSGTVRVRGDLADFPFDGVRDAEMRVLLQLQDVRYAFMPEAAGASAPGWPAVERIQGELEFDRLAMKLRRMQGQMAGYELREVQGGIADVSADRPRLQMQGEGRGPLADVLRVLRLAPPGPQAAAALEPMRATGPSQLNLALDMPLDDPGQTRLRGSLQLQGNELRLAPDLPPLMGARGSIDFDPQGLQLRGMTARLLGGDTSFEGSIGFGGAVRLSAQGQAGAEALRSAAAGGPWAELASLLRGQAAWRANLAVNAGRSEFSLQSNLVGMQVDLPPPLAKPAASSSLPLRLQLAPVADAAPGRPRDSLQLELGELLKLQLQRDRSGPEPVVVRGSLALLDALPPLPPAGWQAALKLGRVDLDAWEPLLEGLGDGAGRPGAKVPLAVQLQAEELRAGARRLNKVKGTLSRFESGDESVWSAQLDAEQLAGEIEYRVPRGGTQAGRVQARLQRLSVPQSEVETVEQMLSQPPRGVPALDIVVDAFELRGRPLGRLQVLAFNRPLPGSAGLLEWQLDRLALSMPEAQLQASGRWQAGGARRMVLDFGLELADSGALLQRLGAGQAMRGGKGRLQGQLSWAGSPLSLDYPSMEGQLQVDIGQGQFLHAKTGGARLLSVLSLQALPRRLTLDFRDLFDEGFAFDSIEGDVRVQRGVARTDTLRMSGAQATVLMQGSADLKHETQDLRVLIVPKFDAAGVALATMAINPAIGLGALVAQWALREPLIAANTSEMHITGSWADPQVEQIARPTATGAARAAVVAPPAPAANPLAAQKKATP